MITGLNPAAGAGLASSLPAMAAAGIGPLPSPPSGSFSINSASGAVGSVLPNFVAVPPSAAAGQAANLQAAVSSLGSMASSGAELASSSAGLASAVSNALNAANRG